MKEGKDKVFFITSNQSKLDKLVDYKVQEKNGVSNFQNIYQETIKYRREDFTTSVFSFEILPKELKDKDKDNKTKRYKTKVNLNYKRDTFDGLVLFKENKNNFIYDLEFQEKKGWTGSTAPPPAIRFSKIDQLKLFNKVLKKKLKVKQADKINLNLILDSQVYLRGQKFDFDFYLEILKSCYSQNEVKTLLMMFNLAKVNLPEKMNPNDYSTVLGLIEKKPNCITKFCSEKDKKEKYFKSFYCILLFFRANFEKDKVQTLLSNKDLWEYFREILPEKYEFFPNIKVPDELILECLKQKNISYNKIKGSLYFGGSIEKVLSIINNNCDIIANCCLNENQKLIMSELANPKQDDDLNKIIDEIKQILDYQLKKKIIFIIFDEEFWKNYIHFNDKKNLKNLVLIKKAVLLCSKADKDLNYEKLALKFIIHSTGLLAIEKGELKNEELLDYIENDDIYFKDRTYESINMRPLTILKGIDLEKADDKFFEKWNNSSIFKIYSFVGYDFKKAVINKIEDMKDFGKLLKLFDYKDKNKFDRETASLIQEKFKKLIKTYKIETCPNFIQEVALFIYIIDQKYRGIKEFMERTIEENIRSVKTLTDIYLYLASNYKDISQEVIERITTYFTNNKENLNGESILFLLKKLQTKHFIKSILNKINNFAIKEEEIFNQEKEVDSFKLLDGIEKEELLKKFPELYETQYLDLTVKLSGEILNKITTGNIKYSKIYSMWVGKGKKELLKERLSIILFNNIEDVEKCMKSIEEKFKIIIKENGFLKKINGVLKEFYEVTHQDNIKKIANLEKTINTGMLNDIETNVEVKKALEDIKNILPNQELDKKFKLKSSAFFLHFFRTKKANNPIKKEEEIFTETENDFKKLKYFFEENWIEKIEVSIIKECYKALKNLDNNGLLKELKFLKTYFNLKNIDDLYLSKLEDEIKIFSKKEEIFQTVNSCIYCISEFGAKPTEFYNSLEKLRNDLSKNISVDKIKEYGKALEKYGINLLEQKPEDKDYLIILNSLYLKKGSLKFIMKLTEEDCRTLQELVSESENTFLTAAEIQDMTKCSNFIHNLNIIKDQTTDQELIKIIIDKVSKTKNISAYFIQYTNNSGQIQELFSQKLDKSQATLKKIKNIIKSSNFNLSISNNEEMYLNFSGSYISDENTNRNVSFDDLIELRGRAMLTKKLGDEKAKEEKETHESNKKFAERVNEIEKINGLLKKIAEKGYSEIIKISIDIQETKPTFYNENMNFKDYEDCSKYLNNILFKTNETQINYYKNEKTQLIRYIYGRQFNLLNSCLKNLSNASISAFLKFLTNDSIQSDVNLEKIDYDYDYELNPKDQYLCLLENINKFLNSFLEKNKITLESIYKQNIIKEQYNNEFRGLYTYLLKDDKDIQKGVEEHILNWYQFLTGHPPMAQTVLLCNEETTSEEIIAFMYRAFLCQYHVIFMVGKIELLTPDKRQTLTSLINTLFAGQEKKMKSCLAFAYSDKTATIVQYLERIKGREILDHKDKKEKEEILYEENVEIICSDKSGVGKSTQIQDKVKKSGKQYIHFPFGGEFNRKDVINRLKKINISNKDAKKTAIHLDLYDSKQTDLMKDFLYSFLITKLYGQNESLFYLSKDVEIKIEIPNGFVDFFLKFPILSMFKNKTVMTIDNLPPLIVPAKINSDIQIVCNYLKLLKSGKLSEKDLYIKGVSMDPNDIKSLLTPEFINVDTKYDGSSLSQKECEELIKENIGINSPTYYQINSFISVLSGQLKKFSMIFLLTAGNLIQSGNMLNMPNLKNIRETMVKSFINNTQHFTQGAFKKLLNSQMETYKVGVEQGKYDEDKQDDIAIKALSGDDEKISFDKIKPSLTFFHEGQGQEFSIISTCERNEKEYQQLYELKRVPVLIQNEFNRSMGINKLEPMPKELNDYRKFTHKMFLSEMKKILSLKNPVYNIDKDEKDKKTKSIEEIVGDYVFTADNFIKMILILLRIRENIPVILMGETGCGKTSLIRKLSELLNNGESTMKILNIHAGITDQEIVDFLFNRGKNGENIIPSIVEEAEALKKSESEEKKKYEAMNQRYFEKKIWIFLDEINTCNCMGLICEMMTKNSCQGIPLPESIVFIGACNPYRMVVKDEEPNGLKIEGTKERKLVYTVNPLPHSLLNFVFNFGNLTKKDEESYIKNMVVSPIESFYWKEIENKNKEKAEKKEEDKEKMKSLENYLSKKEYYECTELKKIASNAIIEAQQYVRDKNDVSSVSLREIRRFSIFYNFFVEYLRNKRILFGKMNQNENFEMIDRYYKNLTDYEIYKLSINLSVYVCYYLRLTKKVFRDEFANKMNKHFGFNFREMPNKEQIYIANNIEMKEGIAKNRALLENLFTLFVCVNSKVPLFIVGKPGCSKSLSVQLLFKSMKGENSDNILFKTLPKLILNSYQGSLGSTSKGVLSIFKKARQIIEKETDDNLAKMISMIYFDEMGLAEHSPNNPLKVIHSELEYDLNEGRKKIAFVGISNWRLDASKMNRGLYLSIPQPDLDDLKTTAQTIAESYSPQLAETNKDLFEALAITYYEYKNELKEKYTKKEDFHGSRDFYHLIKNAMRALLKKASDEQNMDIDEHIKETIGIESLERNFGGLEFEDGKNGISSLEIVKKIFQKKYVNCPVTKKYDVLKRIKENINDKGSRYLLLISKSSVSNYLLSTILSEDDVKKESSFYIGSGFIKDQHSEQYTLKILNKVQLQMEQNKVLLLTDLEPVYPALYDLFNQNFTVVSEKNYARIAIGSSNNTFSLVNDDFKCIVIVDEKAIDKEEAPFLNRFEKHIISFEYLLKEELAKAAEEIYLMVNDLANPNIQENKLKIPYDVSRLLINCEREEIQGIIYSKFSEAKKAKQNLQVQFLEDFVLEKISLTLPQDIILLIKYSGFEQKYNNISEKIINYYQKGEHNNLYNFIKNTENTKSVIYTFTSIDEPLLTAIPDDLSFETKMFGKIKKSNIKDIQISSLSAENELEAELEKIYLDQENKFKIIVFRFNPDETDIMNYIKFFIENHIKEKNYIDENNNNKKAFIFSVHMNRIFEVDKKDPKKKKYIERNELGEIISHLSDFYQIFIDNLNGGDISIIDIMKFKGKELFEKCLNIDKEFLKYIYNVFSYFTYNFTMNLDDQIKKENYSLKVIEYLKEQSELREMISKCILNQKMGQNDILGEILKNKDYFTRDDIEIISVIQRYLSQIFIDNLTQFIFKSEKDHFLSTFIFNKFYTEINDNNNQNKEDKKEKEEEKKIEEVEEEINTNKDNKIKEGNKINEENKKEKNYYMGNQLVKKLIEIYLQTLDLSNTSKFKKKIKNNKITLLLGLKLPGMRLSLNSLRNYIRDELSRNYLATEKEFKYLNQNDEEFNKDLNSLKKKIKSEQTNMETEINKNELFQNLIKFGNEYLDDNRQFYEWLLDDYFLIFLSENLIDIKNSFNDLEDYKSILKKMLSLRFNSGEGGEVDYIRSISVKMLWLESNSEYISILLNIYQKILPQEKNLLMKIEKIIENKEIQYEISPRSQEHTEEINSPFFYIMESLLRVITTDLDLYNNLQDQKFYDFINSVKGIIQDALRIISELIIFSKEVFTIQEFLNIEEKLNIVNKSNLENILKVLDILSKHAKFAKDLNDDERKYKELCDNLQNLYDFLKESLGNTDNFIELILNIFVDEIKKISNDNYRKKQIDIILNNPSLIAKSYPFISILLKNLINNSPEAILDNLDNIRNNHNLYFDSINKSDNDTLNEIILSIFENQFNSYFESIPTLSPEDLEEMFPKYLEYKNIHNRINPTLILFDKSLELFKMCLNFLESIFNNRREKKDEKINNEKLCILYCISYIKMYLNKCIIFNHTINQEFTDFDKIVEAIKGNAINNFRRMIKIYVFKVFFYLLNGNYHEFSNYHYPNHQITFFEEFKDKFNEKKEAMLNYYLLPNGEELKKYQEELELFESYKFNNFNNPIKQFKDYIEKNGIDIFYTISTNIIVSNLALKNYVANQDEYSKYSSFTKSLFDAQLKLPEITKKLFLLFSNDDVFNKTMKPKLTTDENLADIDSNSFEVLLYGLRICLQTSNCENPNGYFYSEIISNNCEKILSGNCIPGNNILNNIYINNYYIIEKHLNTKPQNIGAYVCSCGLYYDIDPCGFPNESSVCFNCGQKTGNGRLPPGITGCHGFVHRPGHYRIFKNIQAKQAEFNKYGDNDRNIPNKLLSQYKVEVIDPLIEKSKFGISKVTKIIFENSHQNVRKLSQVGYRLLSFILYSHLFYSNCLGFISNENMKKYICDGMTCIKMILVNWNILKDALQSKSIQIIQIFMNLIFNKLVDKLKNCKEIKSLQERENFEGEIEKLLEEAYKEYEEYSKKYLEINQEALQLDRHNMKSLMLENNDIKNYDEENYPFYKYFLMTTYPSKDSFVNELKKVQLYENKYPLLASFIDGNIEQLNILKNLPDYNDFINFMIDNYSYKITREEAGKKLLKDEEIYKNEKFKKKFEKFKKVWKQLKPFAVKYGCRDEMPPIDLDENKSVAHFLNDNGEICKGMYIAAGYQFFIDCQNSFLNNLIGPLKQSGILHHFVKNMEKTIDVQRAKKNEVLNFDKANESFMEIIYENCKRNIFREDNSINYMNYKQYIYNFDSVEKILGELILPGKVGFNSHEKLIFVTYCFEGFRGTKTSVFSDFSDKNEQINLSIEKKQMIYDAIKDKLKNQEQDLSKILFSIQLLIYYLTQERRNPKDEIKTVIGELPDYINLSKECIEFLETVNLRIEEITGLYSYFELLCFKPIVDNLRAHYKKKLDNKKAENILKLFEEKKINAFTKQDLATACRKMISRYLVSTRDDTDYNENNQLNLHLEREELWTGIWKNNEENIKRDLELLNKEYNKDNTDNKDKKEELTLAHCYELYNLLGGDEQKILENIKIKGEEDEKEKENKENENEEEGKIVRKKKPKPKPKPKKIVY